VLISKSLQLPRRLDSHREFEHRRPVGVERLRERAWERVHGAERPPSKKIAFAPVDNLTSVS